MKQHPLQTSGGKIIRETFNHVEAEDNLSEIQRQKDFLGFVFPLDKVLIDRFECF
jgi:hypothetical protein